MVSMEKKIVPMNFLDPNKPYTISIEVCDSDEDELSNGNTSEKCVEEPGLPDLNGRFVSPIQSNSFKRKHVDNQEKNYLNNTVLSSSSPMKSIQNTKESVTIVAHNIDHTSNNDKREGVTKSLSKVSDNLLNIIEMHGRLTKNNKLSNRDKDKIKKHFLSMKYHYFSLSYDIVVSLFIPRLTDKNFITNFLNDTINNSRVNGTFDCSDKTIKKLFSELIKWTKYKKEQIDFHKNFKRMEQDDQNNKTCAINDNFNSVQQNLCKEDNVTVKANDNKLLKSLLSGPRVVINQKIYDNSNSVNTNVQTIETPPEDNFIFSAGSEEQKVRINVQTKNYVNQETVPPQTNATSQCSSDSKNVRQSDSNIVISHLENGLTSKSPRVVLKTSNYDKQQPSMNLTLQSNIFINQYEAPLHRNTCNNSNNQYQPSLLGNTVINPDNQYQLALHENIGMKPNNQPQTSLHRITCNNSNNQYQPSLLVNTGINPDNQYQPSLLGNTVINPANQYQLALHENIGMKQNNQPQASLHRITCNNSNNQYQPSFLGNTGINPDNQYQPSLLVNTVVNPANQYQLALHENIDMKPNNQPQASLQKITCNNLNNQYQPSLLENTTINPDKQYQLALQNIDMNPNNQHQASLHRNTGVNPNTNNKVPIIQGQTFGIRPKHQYQLPMYGINVINQNQTPVYGLIGINTINQHQPLNQRHNGVNPIQHQPSMHTSSKRLPNMQHPRKLQRKNQKDHRPQKEKQQRTGQMNNSETSSLTMSNDNFKNLNPMNPATVQNKNSEFLFQNNTSHQPQTAMEQCIPIITHVTSLNPNKADYSECFVCGKLTTHKCRGCFYSYCGEGCQTLDWCNHMLRCEKFIEFNDS